MPLWTQIAATISSATGTPFDPLPPQSLGGGCINAAYRLPGRDGRAYFVKLNEARLGAMFAAEAEGLAELAASATLRVPTPIGHGEVAGQAFLVLELLDLSGHGGLEALGRGLAALHRTTRPHFGWHRDNTIGATPQPNGEETDWATFWGEHRLGFQLDLAARHGHRGALQQRGEALRAALPALLSDHRPQPSLLHGDLWSGNYAISAGGEPVIFDPAVYYGDREADLAMTELFGGFGPRFYAAYQEAWPLDPGYPIRKELYNLYHILNHLNLFGGGYGSQALRMMERLLAELHS